MNSKRTVSVLLIRILSGVLPVIVTSCGPSAPTISKVDAIDCAVDSLYVWNKKPEGTNVVLSLSCPKPQGLYALEYRKNNKEWIKSFAVVQSNTGMQLIPFERWEDREYWMEADHAADDIKNSFLVKEGEMLTIPQNEAKSIFKMKDGMNVLEVYITWLPE